MKEPDTQDILLTRQGILRFPKKVADTLKDTNAPDSLKTRSGVLQRPDKALKHLTEHFCSMEDMFPEPDEYFPDMTEEDFFSMTEEQEKALSVIMASKQ